MRYYTSRVGETLSEEEWKQELDKFWLCFEKGCSRIDLPKRPDDAWDRYVKLLGLEEVL